MKNKKKILLVLSLLPYLIFLIKGIFNICIEGTLNLYTLIEPFVDFWFSIVTKLNILLIILSMLCVGYQIYYVIDKLSKKKSDKLENYKFIIYIINFIPYLSLVYYGIMGIDIGFFYNIEMVYGFKAIMYVFLMGCLMPVYPLLIIFQIIFIIRKYKIFSYIQKIIFYITIISILLLLIVPSVMYLI